MNTLDNMLVCYFSYREMGKHPRQAFDSLGIYGGDDGVTADMEPLVIQRVVQDIGLRIKAVQRPATAPVTFLARTYYNPKGAAYNTMDYARQLGKLHVHPSREVLPPETILWNKISGMADGTPNCPLVRALYAFCLRVMPADLRVRHEHLRPWLIGHDGVPSDDSCIAPVGDCLAEISRQLDMTVADVQRYINGIAHWRGLEDITPIKVVERPIPPPGIQLGDDRSPGRRPPPTSVPRLEPPAPAVGLGESKRQREEVKGPARTPAGLASPGPSCADCKAVIEITPEFAERLRVRGFEQPKRCRACLKLKKERFAAEGERRRHERNRAPIGIAPIPLVLEGKEPVVLPPALLAAATPEVAALTRFGQPRRAVVETPPVAIAVPVPRLHDSAL